MTPIYASDRIDLSGWYAYKQPSGQLVIWDGGVNRTTEESGVGIWCPFSGRNLDQDPKWLDKLPKMPMYGYLDKDHLTVIDFPHVDEVLNMTGRLTDNAVMFMVSQDGAPLPFFLSVLNAPNVCEESEVCDFVRCRILPEDKEAALKAAREMGNETYMRHPLSYWTRQRNPLFANVKRPERRRARIREIKQDARGYVDEVTAWVTPENLVTFYPLYEGDQYADNKAFKPKAPINLYLSDETVLGYD